MKEMNSGGTISRRSWSLTAGVAGLVLVGYIGFLLITNYLTQLDLQQATLDQLRQDSEKRSIAVSYFYSERRNDLRDLATSRVIAVFFESRLLGIPAEYGSRGSLRSIGEMIDRVVQSRMLDKDTIYTRIVLVDKNGELLVDSHPSKKPLVEERDWAKLLRPEVSDALIEVEKVGGANEVRISTPCFFWGEYSGQIIAWVEPQIVQKHLFRMSSGSLKRLEYIVSGEKQTPLSDDGFSGFDLTQANAAGRLEHGKIIRLSDVNHQGKTQEILVSLIPVEGTPFSMVSVLRESELFGTTTPWQILLALGIISFLVLGVLGAIWTINTRNLLLNARLVEEARSKREVEEKNQQLIKEIAERKKAETAMRDSEERYRRFFEDDLSGAFISSPEGRLLACNPAFAKIFGYSSTDEAREAGLARLYLDSKRHETFLDLLRKEQKLEDYESEYRRLDGKIIQTLENVIGAFNQQGDLVEIKGFVIDITERKRLEEHLRQGQKMEAIGTLAGGIAHDFNNILTAILGYAEMAMHYIPEDNRAQRNMVEVLKAGNRARDLVRQILTFSRQTKQERKPLRVDTVVKEALKLLRASLPSTIEIRQAINTRTGTVLADAIQIHQVLMNLCANASYAMRDGGGVMEVSLSDVDMKPDSDALQQGMQPGHYVEIAVRDTGCGISHSAVERIFDPFFTTKVPGEGTGMGLAVVHGIVRSHGGVVRVESEEGKGSIFRVYLPGIEGEGAEEVLRPEPVLQGERFGQILFVDDEEPILKLGKQMLEYLGYSVTTRVSSLEALETFRSQPAHYDLIITDQTMPKMTGAELAREILFIRPGIPIILCTGYSEAINQEGARAIGIREFVAKPFVMSELAGVARRVLDQKERRIVKIADHMRAVAG